MTELQRMSDPLIEEYVARATKELRAELHATQKRLAEVEAGRNLLSAQLRAFRESRSVPLTIGEVDAVRQS